MNNTQDNIDAKSILFQRKQPINISDVSNKTSNKSAHSLRQTDKDETDEQILADLQNHYARKQAFKYQIKRFVEISKYFSSPLRKSASYLSEIGLVSYPNHYMITYQRGGVTTQYVKFCNLTLEPVYIKLYKLIPDLEQLKYINLSLSRVKRIPPGLSFDLGIIYNDVNEKPPCAANMIFVASRKTTTPCYQICEIELQIVAKQRLANC